MQALAMRYFTDLLRNDPMLKNYESPRTKIALPGPGPYVETYVDKASNSGVARSYNIVTTIIEKPTGLLF